MNKNSLYRYYRPQDFDDFVGQKNIVTILKNQIKSHSFSHALLFTGPRGCGKTSLARIFAKAVNCSLKEKETQIPCNHCSQCLQAQQGKALHLIELDGASNNGVEEIRNLIENSRLSPIGATYKVFIIDEVHMLSKAAFNALLKTLEEPPKHVIFILATTEMDKIPATISSRCQMFNFHKITKLEMQQRLNFIARAEQIEITESAINEIFYLSEGSLRDALNILQQLIAIGNKLVDSQLVQEYFQTPTQQDKIQILKHLSKNEPQELINNFELINQKGLNLDLFILGLLDLAKEIIEFKVTKNPNYLKQINLEEKDLLEVDLDYYFLIGDVLSEAFQKNNWLKGDYSYMLIDLLKTINFQNKTTNNHLINENAKVPNLKEVHNSWSFNEFLKLYEQLLSEQKPRLSSLTNYNHIFNVLSNPLKKERDDFDKKIALIFKQDQSKMMVNPRLAKTFISWYRGSIVAVSDCEILIRFDNEEELSFFHGTIQDSQWVKILKDNFGHSFAVYGIDRKSWELVKQEFISRKKNNALKLHHHVSWHDIYGSMRNEVQEKEAFNALANDLFGNLVKSEGNKILDR